ncbi:21.7 kDa class VI heat shock protein [Acorus calamus]|uniref:21.7 kDa class VI heat shock protein n=1 Tax=Acorus calamus TaxID=4465 RepID=A0AAV9FH88_ACOCL|nr:21.7 kDa class VI heat shock protein [Acorus calamus]
MSHRKALEIRYEDRNPHKWCKPLSEDVFNTFKAKAGSCALKFFDEGSLFSPLLFGKFFDPADAFPLWDFEAEALLQNCRSSNACSVDWSETDIGYILRAEIPEVQQCEIQICVEDGKVLEISGQCSKQEKAAKDWRRGNWWEFGYVRRLELPENADWKKLEAYIDDDIFLEIKISKNSTTDVGPQ